MLKPYAKPPLSFAEQLQLLESRGLKIPDQTLALGHLSSISYYRLSAYWYPFLQRDTNGRVIGVFEPGTDFDQVVRLYEFDRHLRLLVMDAIVRIDVHIRTLVTYHLGHRYRAFVHTDSAHFPLRFNHAI